MILNFKFVHLQAFVLHSKALSKFNNSPYCDTMIKNLHYLFLFYLLITTIHAQNTWQLDLPTNHKSSFEAAYQKYPEIPKGILESVAYTSTHLKHLKNQQMSCVGIPVYHGIMGLIEDGKGYFRSNMNVVNRYSGIDEKQLKDDASIQVLAYAKTYKLLMQIYGITSNQPEDHLAILNALSELPDDGSNFNNYAFDAHVYSVLKNLNAAKFQKTYALPAYNIDLEKVFGKDRYQILSANSLVMDNRGIHTSSGAIYQNDQHRSAAPPCSDLSLGFPYTVIQDAADPSNYSSRNGTAISHVTIHTMQGSYSGAISWFKNPSSNVSAHYNMRAADGQITQMVCEFDKGWHVGNSNPYTVGIEHEGYVADPSWYTDITYEASAALTKDIALRNGIPIIRTYDINGDGTVNPISDGCFKIKGHQHYPSQTHYDPGPNWDWNRYYDLLNPTASANSSTYTTATGNFYDSGGPTGNYTNDERTFYRIEPTGASSLSLNFSSLDLELNYDYLYIYDGDSDRDQLIAVLNGSSLPSTIVANSGKMLLEFRSDCGTVASGWEANWTTTVVPVSCAKTDNLLVNNNDQNSVQLNWDAVPAASSYEIRVKQSIANGTWSVFYSNTNSFDLSGIASDAQYLWTVRTICSPNDTAVYEGSIFVNTEPTNDVVTNACEGIFTDSGGEFGLYRKNEDYTFTIAPVNATSVSLTFSEFDIENNYDFMYIYDGSSTAAPLLGTYTSTNIPPLTTSTGNSLTIRFTSDIATQNPGWRATWTCSNALLTYPNPILLDNSLTGNLNCGIAYHDFYDSGNATGLYGNNENNTQTFCNPDPTKAVRLSFQPNPTAAQQLTISSLEDGNDYLYIYNGPDTSSNLIGVYTGASSAAPQPGTFVSSGACLTVRMNTDGNFAGDGWIARLYCSDPPTDLGLVEVGGTEGTKVFTDLGGTTANYGNNENYTITYCPHASAPSNEGVWAEFGSAIGLERNWDYLYVYDGMDTENARLICAYTGSLTNSNTLETIKASIENSSGCLTFQFYSDGATTASGWSANLSTGAARLAFGAENCTNATLVGQTDKDYAGSTTLATGTPGSFDPSLDITLASLPECSGSNAITRLENSIWYRFITPDALCIPTSFNIDLNNISCRGEGIGGSGLQFVLYEVDNCQSGAAWPVPVYCADKLVSGSSVDIKDILKPSQNYYLMIDGFTGQHCNFDIRFSVTTNGDPNSCFLPLDLLSFSGHKQAETNILQWTTANEENVYGFYIQRLNPINHQYEEIGFVPSVFQQGMNAGSYTFEDTEYNRNTVSYYRLRQVDIGGLQSYSPIVSIDRGNQSKELLLKVFPNPANDHLFFGLQSETKQSYALILFDRTGRKIYQQEGKMPIGYWNEKLNTSQLSAGMYLYQLRVGDQTLSGKFEKL